MKERSKKLRKEDEDDGEGTWETVKGGVAIPSVSKAGKPCQYTTCFLSFPYLPLSRLDNLLEIAFNYNLIIYLVNKIVNA